ncbi:UNVERIFIED_CONTAM: hypothetical protein FKN15_027289 [Acipenser sinensis]
MIQNRFTELCEEYKLKYRTPNCSKYTTSNHFNAFGLEGGAEAVNCTTCEKKKLDCWTYKKCYPDKTSNKRAPIGSDSAAAAAAVVDDAEFTPPSLYDWLTQRTSNVYSLGDVLNIEASIDGTNHMPLRLFVDSCVATMVPDRNASPRYVFIDNSGCLVDAKVSGSGSRFISPRVQNTKLQLRLDAFRFYSDPRSSIYITCHLKVAAASQNVDSVNKACSFTASSSRWSSVDGSDQVCSCCNTGSCGTGAPYRGRRGSEAAGSMGEGSVTLSVLGRSGEAFALEKEAVWSSGFFFFTASSSRWSSVDGSDQVCSCCNTGSCGTGAPFRRRRGRGAAGSMVLDWEGDARVGPLVILDALKESEAQSLQLEAEDRTAQGFPVEVLVLAGVVAAVALGCIAALAVVIYRRLGKPTA